MTTAKIAQTGDFNPFMIRSRLVALQGAAELKLI
jgi:hypothetical protein